MESYPVHWAEVFAVRLENGLGCWPIFRSCFTTPRTLAALQEGLPAELLSELMAAATSPEPDPETRQRLATLLREWVQSERLARRDAGQASDA